MKPIKLDKCQLDASGKPLPMVQCPACKHEMDAATRLGNDGARPSSGDFSICIDCGEILIFTEDMGARMADLNDMLAAQKVPGLFENLTKAQNLIRRVRPLRNHGH